MENEFRMMQLAELVESKLNPRRHFDKDKLAELTESVRQHGVLEPLLARERVADGLFEIVAGARRYRAAKEAGLATVPVRVVQLDDMQAIEVMVVENGQRADVHPLEEAQGYHLLHTRWKYEVARIAEKIGFTAMHVYNRLKLLNLTKEAQKLFLEDRFTTGHAIVLARLSPADQARAIDSKVDRFSGRGGLWQAEQLVLHPDEKRGGEQHLKPVSVRELQGWVDEHTKLEADQVDQMVLPETAATLAAATEDKEKVVRITHEIMTPEEAKGGAKVILGRSWKRADGQRGSKQCERSVIGMVVIGAGRGEALRVCIDKKACTVHWNDLIRAAKKREREVTKAASTGEDRAAVRRKKEQEEEAKRLAEGERWQKALPSIRSAFEAAIRKAGTGASGAVGKFVLEEFEAQILNPGKFSAPVGKTGDDLLRHMATRLVFDTVDVEDGWGRDQVVETGKRFGLDLKKILDQAAPVEKPAKARPAGKPAAGPLARKKAGRKAA